MVAGKRSPFCLGVFLVFILAPQNNAKLFPTLARIALDVLPSQASSVPCERVFSGSKLTATDHRARLGSQLFEELQLMKGSWRGLTVDLAQLNSDIIEEIFDDGEDLLLADEELTLWDEGV